MKFFDRLSDQQILYLVNKETLRFQEGWSQDQRMTEFNERFQTDTLSMYMLKTLYRYYGIIPVWSKTELNRARYNNFVRTEYGTLIKCESN